MPHLGEVDHAAYRRDQVSHRGRTRSIAASQETRNASRVGDSLDSKLACSTEPRGKVVEEQGAYSAAVTDVACLAGTAGVDDRDSTAGSTIGELVVCAAGELAFVLGGRGRGEAEGCRESSDE